MTTIATLHDAVEDRMAENERSPAAQTEALLADTRRALDTLEADRKRHVAETQVALERFDNAVAGSLANLKATEATIAADLESNRAEQERQRSFAETRRRELTANRRAELVEMDRQKSIYEAALAAGAKVIGSPLDDVAAFDEAE